MTLRILVTRPREDAAALADALAGLGIEPVLEPLMCIEYIDGPALNLDGVQALLVTSANGVRAFANRDPRRHLPVFAVGDASAGAASLAGFADVSSASGDVAALAALVHDRLDADGGDLLHVAGTRLAGDLAGMLAGHGFSTRREVLYEDRVAEVLSAEAILGLEEENLDGVVFFSPRTAAIFAGLVRRAGLEGCIGRLAAFCLSPAVAGKAEALSWGRVVIAPKPEQDALVQAIDDFQAAGG
jgi:uroporphyrinogen-III synthase